MQLTRNGNRFQVLDKATQAAGVAVSLAMKARGILTLTGACRVRHCACNDPPASPHVEETRTRCLALFSFDEKVPGTAPIASLRARARPSQPRGRPPACHRRGRNPFPSPPRDRADGRRWAARGTSRGGPEGRRSGTPRHGRSGRDRLHHFRIAYASAKEVDVHLRILCLSHPTHRGNATNALQLFDDVRAMTWRLINPKP